MRKYLLTLMTYGLFTYIVKSMCHEHENKYFLYGPNSHLMRALPYYTNKLEIASLDMSLEQTPRKTQELKGSGVEHQDFYL